MTVQLLEDSGPRARTRKAILEAAMAVLVDNPAASLSEIATAAGVGRSTLHRHFPERTELIRALALHVHELSTAAIEEADPASGPPMAALRRVVESHLDLGSIFLYVYNEPSVVADPELRAHLDTGDEAIVEVLTRMSCTATPPGWARRVFWALIDAGSESVRDDKTPKHQVVDAIIDSLTEGTINPSRT